jgi:hypothetical protein
MDVVLTLLNGAMQSFYLALLLLTLLVGGIAFIGDP